MGIEALLVFAFFHLNMAERIDRFRGGALATFDVRSIAEEPTVSRSLQRPAPARVVPRQPIPTTAPPIPPATPALDMLELTREEFAAADIARLGSNAPGYKERRAGSGQGDSAMVGNAPNGQPLYAAEWVREPTVQELAYYLPKAMPPGGGTGLVACKTAPRNRVEDCVELESLPRGSRLAAAVRNAAWQFLVRPPRIGGRPMIGQWVRIRIDYSPADATE